jgi:hypothetical protein
MGLRPYASLEELVAGSKLTADEVHPLFQGEVENVDFLSGITIENAKVGTGQGLLCEVANTIIASLAYAVLPVIHQELQPLLPPCLQKETDQCRLSTLLRNHTDRGVPTTWSFSVL